MNKALFNILTFTIIFTLNPIFMSDLQAENTVWSYQNKDSKPEKWGTLDPDYTLCSTGKNQSPVNITSEKRLLDVQTRGIKFNYGLITPINILNSGQLIQVFIDDKHTPAANIKVDNILFKLIRLDIHIPSEHTLDGKHFPMEIQFIHKSKNKQFAIVSRMVKPGRPDRTLRKLLESLPMQAGKQNPLPENALRNTEMKKKFANYYRYNGSFTQPPCAEGIRWFIMKQAMTLSKEQYEKFKAALKQDNNRPIQNLNARIILE